MVIKLDKGIFTWSTCPQPWTKTFNTSADAQSAWSTYL